MKLNNKVDADKVRKYSVLIDKAFPAMDGTLRRAWAERDAFSAELMGLDNPDDFVSDIGNKTLAINGGIWSETYDALAQHLKDGEYETLQINSGGGAASVGVACYHLVRDAGLRVEVVGWAFSAATDIAVAGSPLVIKRGASIGIHRPWNIVMGNADDLREAADLLDVMGDAMFELYAARTKTKKQLNELRELYQKDSLLSGKDAVRLGLADEYEGDGKEDKAKSARDVFVESDSEPVAEEPEAAEGMKPMSLADLHLECKFANR